MRITDDFVLFWESYSIYSQWYPSKFTENGVEFVNAEQYMMYHKATTFGDLSIAEKILKSSDPKSMKRLGRQVKGYVDSVWAEKRLSIVTHGSYLKFSQNEKLKEEILKTGNREFVEASPLDLVWGVGLHWSDDLILDRRNWAGSNLLGVALGTARDMLK